MWHWRHHYDNRYDVIYSTGRSDDLFDSGRRKQHEHHDVGQLHHIDSAIVDVVQRARRRGRRFDNDGQHPAQWRRRKSRDVGRWLKARACSAERPEARSCWAPRCRPAPVRAPCRSSARRPRLSCECRCGALGRGCGRRLGGAPPDPGADLEHDAYLHRARGEDGGGVRRAERVAGQRKKKKQHT